MDGEFDLAKFDEYREDNRLEVKKARNGLPDDLWETYSAFANSNGGCIILGVKEHDDKSWYTTGLKDVGKLKKSFWDTIHNHKKVSVVLLTDDDLKDYEINGDTIRLGKKQMLRGGESQPRNKLILNMLNYIGIGERAGSGVPNIYKIWKEENFEEPKVEETSGRDGIIRTIVTLPLVLKGSTLAISEKQPEKSPEKPLKHSEIMEKRIGAVLEMIKADPSVSRAEISARMQISDSQARTAIEKLKERGIICREGSDTNGKWVISL